MPDAHALELAALGGLGGFLLDGPQGALIGGALGLAVAGPAPVKMPTHTSVDDLNLEEVRGALSRKIDELREDGQEQEALEAERVLAELK